MRGVWLCVALAACLDPTEVTIELTSDTCDQLGPVDIVVGTTDASVASATCPSVGSESGRIGTLVFVPSSRGNKFEVTAGACDKTRTHCIRAARSVRFVPHTPLRLPISLDRACMDVLCQADFTCSGGACVPEDVSDHCIGGVCTPIAPPDAGPSCTPPWINPPPATSFVWHFDSPTTVDQNALCAPTTAIDIGPGMGTCGTAAFEKAYDGGSSSNETVGCKTAGSGKNVHAAFWFRVGAGSYYLQKFDTMAISGWMVEMSGGGTVGIRTADPTYADQTTALGPPLAKGTWHSFEFDASNGNLTAWLDKVMVFSGSGLRIGPSPNADLLIGPLGGGAVDELYIYP